MRKYKLKRGRSLRGFIYKAVHELDKNGAINKAVKPVEKALATFYPFVVAKNDPRRKQKRFKKPIYGTITPEIHFYAVALVTAAWVSWVEQAKSLWHFKETSVGGILFLDNQFIPMLLNAVGIGRSKAYFEKISRKQYPARRSTEFIRTRALGAIRRATR